jgi:hypothetical protein
MTSTASSRPAAALRLALAMAALSLGLVACAGKPAADTVVEDSASAAPEARPIGGDRDAHGCLPAAGYAWCEREKRCVRPWELAKDAGFENTAEGFARHCDAAPAQPAG